MKKLAMILIVGNTGGVNQYFFSIVLFISKNIYIWHTGIDS